MAYNPKKTPCDLNVLIETEQWKVDTTTANELFKKAWNSAVSDEHPEAMIIGEGPLNLPEWQWVLSPLIMTCRRAFARAVRIQFDDETTHSSMSSTKDMTDRMHNYFAVGAVWHSMLGYFSRSHRVIDAIEENMFTTKDQARKSKLPVEEINAR